MKSICFALAIILALTVIPAFSAGCDHAFEIQSSAAHDSDPADDTLCNQLHSHCTHYQILARGQAALPSTAGKTVAPFWSQPSLASVALRPLLEPPSHA